MKNIIKLGIALIGLCGIAYLTMQTSSQAQLGVRIALFTPLTHPALQEVEQGFKETLNKALPDASYITFNANGNKTLMRAQAEEIVAGNYDLIFTMGAATSQTVAELLAKKQIEIPHVFGAIDGSHLAHELQQIHPSSTGVYLDVDYTKEMDELFGLKPDIKNILLVYDPTHGTGLEKYKDQLESYVRTFGATLQAIEIYSSHEIQQKVTTSLPQTDVVLVLIDNTVVAGIDALIALCNKYNVILMVSDIPSVKKGATVAYGITEYESGSGAAQKAVDIMVHGKSAQDVPVAPITNFKLVINNDAAQASLLTQQGEK